MLIKNKKGQTEEEFLKEYDSSKYEKPSVTVDMLIFTIGEKESESYRELEKQELQLLLIKRGEHPYINKWALPGGFCNVDESLDQAARRELESETGVKDVYLEQLYTWGDVNRDSRMRVISTSFLALVPKDNLKIKAGDDASEASYFTIKTKIISENKEYTEKGAIVTKNVLLTLCNKNENLNGEIEDIKIIEGNAIKRDIKIKNGKDFAFDHCKIIYYAIERLRNKIEYTDIAFNLMPEFFSLTELQKMYEVILDKPYTAANFRRKISKMIEETEYTTADFKKRGHKPAKLFKFNPYWDI